MLCKIIPFKVSHFPRWKFQLASFVIAEFVTGGVGEKLITMFLLAKEKRQTRVSQIINELKKAKLLKMFIQVFLWAPTRYWQIFSFAFSVDAPRNVVFGPSKKGKALFAGTTRRRREVKCQNRKNRKLFLPSKGFCYFYICLFIVHWSCKFLMKDSFFSPFLLLFVSSDLFRSKLEELKTIASA